MNRGDGPSRSIKLMSLNLLDCRERAARAGSVHTVRGRVRSAERWVNLHGRIRNWDWVGVRARASDRNLDKALGDLQVFFLGGQASHLARLPRGREKGLGAPLGEIGGGLGKKLSKQARTYSWWMSDDQRPIVRMTVESAPAAKSRWPRPNRLRSYGPRVAMLRAACSNAAGALQHCPSRRMIDKGARNGGRRNSLERRGKKNRPKMH